MEFHEILLKIENNEKLNVDEIGLIELIKQEKPDCLAYKSVANKDGVNFLFFEKGFKKLSLREVKLYLGERKSKNTSKVSCAGTSDYTPYIEQYGVKFQPIARQEMDKDYKYLEEYKKRNMNCEKSRERRINSW